MRCLSTAVLFLVFTQYVITDASRITKDVLVEDEGAIKKIDATPPIAQPNVVANETECAKIGEPVSILTVIHGLV